MLFNSLIFPVFLISVLTLYWFLNDQRWRNVLLLAASFVFYGWWDWRFLGLLLLSSGIDYLVALGMDRPGAPRRLLLGVSLTTNLGILCIFKYCNFFIDNFCQVLETVGLHASWSTLHLVLPVGVSFYTFQALSYTMDVYRGKTQVCYNPVRFLAYISFFPQLVAGPIEQSSSLLHQFYTPKKFDPEQATFGLRCILWGFVLKCVIADNLAPLVGRIYDHAEAASGFELLLATYSFAFQIYGDFSGYTLIAIGAAALLGFRLSQNFRSPYLSTSVPEFWTRWHITLGAWFREYVYIWLLGGSRVSKRRQVFNVLATFGLSGLWHGANWTYVVWGLLNGSFYFAWSSDDRRPRWQKLLYAVLTFHVICLGWVFFRSLNLAQSLTICGKLFNPASYAGWNVSTLSDFTLPALLVAGVVIAELYQRFERDIVLIDRVPRLARLGLYYALILAFVFLGEFSRRPFIYFQF
jgi:alginate O-acetyltransferase complex protein AlgI